MRRKKVIGYLRVSTVDQDTQKNEAAVLKFANDRDLGRVELVSEKVSGLKSWKNRKLAEVVSQLQSGDVMIVPELSRLGRSLADVLEVLNMLSAKQVKVYSVKEGFQLNGNDIQSKVMRTMLGLFAEIDSDLRSLRTKEGLQAAKEKGRLIGRPKGVGKSRLDPHRDEIISLLKNGSKKTFIAQKFNVEQLTLHNWLKRHKLHKIKPQL